MLRKELRRLAAENPDLRVHLLPLLREGRSLTPANNKAICTELEDMVDQVAQMGTLMRNIYTSMRELQLLGDDQAQSTAHLVSQVTDALSELGVHLKQRRKSC